MRNALAALCLLSPAVSLAAPATPLQPPLPRLFISPVGEPFRAAGPSDDPVAAWFGQADADRSASLSRTEMEADAARFFATLDVNRDGEIDPEETSRYEREVAPEIQLGQQMGPWNGGRRRTKEERKRARESANGLQGAGRFSWLNIPQPIAAADADFNRGVSREEFASAAAARLQRLDTNQDGALTRAELPLLPEQWSEDERKKARKTPRPVEGIAIPIE